MPITLITATHTYEHFSLVQDSIAQTTYDQEIQWIIACSCSPADFNFTLNQLVIQTGTTDDIHDMNNNLLTALPFVAFDKCLIIESDDYYRADYISKMALLLDDFPLCGLSPSFYYHIPSSTWDIINFGNACALACTGFTGYMFEDFERACKQGSPLVDTWLWLCAQFGSIDRRIASNAGEHIGLKYGQGAGAYQKPLAYQDIDGSVLKKWLKGAVPCP